MNHVPYVVDHPRKGYCHASVGEGFHTGQCSRAIKNVEQGHLWCKQHTPSLIQAKYEAKEARRVVRAEARDARWAADRKAEATKEAELVSLRSENKKLRAKVKRLEKNVAYLTGNGDST